MWIDGRGQNCIAGPLERPEEGLRRPLLAETKPLQLATAPPSRKPGAGPESRPEERVASSLARSSVRAHRGARLRGVVAIATDRRACSSSAHAAYRLRPYGSRRVQAALLGPYGLTGLSLNRCTVIGISRFRSAVMRARYSAASRVWCGHCFSQCAPSCTQPHFSLDFIVACSSTHHGKIGVCRIWD